MPTPLTDADKVIRNDTGQEIAAAIRAISKPDADDIIYDNTTSELESENVQDAINEVLNIMKSCPTVTSLESSPIASFQTDLLDNLAKCVVYINAVQLGTGTPSPDNVCSISGWQNVGIVKFAVTGNVPSYITVYNRYLSLTSASWRYSNDSRSIAIPCLPDTTYTITGYPDDIGLYRFATIREESLPTTSSQTAINAYQIVEFTSYADIGKAYTFTTDSQATYIIVQVSASRINDFVDNGTVTPSTLITISLGQTVYGGYLDVLSGVLTITHIGTDLANYTGTVTKITQSSHPERTYFRFDDLTPYPLIIDGELICDKYEKNSITTSTSDIGVGLGNPSALGHSTVYFRPEDANDYTISTIMTFIQTTLGGLQIVYKLQEADYITVQLSSNQIVTLLGQNNILADTGNIEIKYLETVGHKLT